jgi:hypothetical protein
MHVTGEKVPVALSTVVAYRYWSPRPSCPGSVQGRSKVPLTLQCSVADPDPGSGTFLTPWIWDPVPF